MKVDSRIYKKGDGSLSFETAHKMISWFVESLNNLRDRKKEMSCILVLNEDEVTMSLFTDREGLDFNPFTPGLLDKGQSFIKNEVKLKENELVYKGTLREKKVIL